MAASWLEVLGGGVLLQAASKKTQAVTATIGLRAEFRDDTAIYYPC
jgi:hypothetical protein